MNLVQYDASDLNVNLVHIEQEVLISNHCHRISKWRSFLRQLKDWHASIALKLKLYTRISNYLLFCLLLYVNSYLFFSFTWAQLQSESKYRLLHFQLILYSRSMKMQWWCYTDQFSLFYVIFQALDSMFIKMHQWC